MTKEMFQIVLTTYLHRPYIWGGDDPIRGLDCSGGVQEWLSVIGLDPDGDQTAQAMFDIFSKNNPVQKGPHVLGSSLDAGYLVFFGSSEKSITHIAMGFSKNEIIEFGGGGSKTNNQQNAIDQNAYCRIRPFGKRKDVVAVIRLNELPW